MEQVKPGVWLINAENRGRFPYAHSLYLNSKQKVLIDTGAGHDLEQVRGKVDQVFLSHYHRDHVARNDLFPEAHFRIFALDAPGVESVEGFSRLSGLNRMAGEFFWDYVKQSGFKATNLDGHLKDGERFDLGSVTLQVVHTPGHTPGHCAFLVEEYGLVFAADVDLTSFGPWYGNISSDPELFRQSIQRIRDLKPSLLLTSHSKPVTEKIDQRLAEYGAVIERRQEAIYNHLRARPCTLDQLIDRKIIFGRHPRPELLYRFFEGNMIRKHLQSLERQGLLRSQGNGEYSIKQ